MTGKVCLHCGKEKPLTEFYSNRQKYRRVQHRPECKSCTKKKAKLKLAHRAAYMRKYRERQRGRDQ